MVNKEILNSISFDVEEYFQVHNFADIIPIELWNTFESRIEYQLNFLLDFLDEMDIKCTFFVLGWVAERYPEVIKGIYYRGHEISSHSYSHKLIFNQTPTEFKEDLIKSIKILEDLTGDKVLGFRAPSFSVTRKTIWAFEIIGECNLLYDSSIMPSNNFWHKRYGDIKGEYRPYKILPDLWEFPISVASLKNLKIPIGGGGWLRHLPFRMIMWGLKQINLNKKPIIIYIHPWEFDINQPKIKAGIFKKFRHYRNISKTKERLETICKDFKFVLIKELLKNYK